MSEGKLRGYQTIPTSDKCNGRVNSFKIGDRDAFHCTNGNHLRNSPMNVDKTQGVNVQMSQMEHGRSHRCLQRETVQTRFNNASVYSKFAFHWIYNVVLLVAVCSVTSGQQQESRLNMRNTGESLFPVHVANYFYSNDSARLRGNTLAIYDLLISCR